MQPVRTTVWEPKVIIITPVLGVKVELIRRDVVDGRVVLQVVRHGASEAIDHAEHGDGIAGFALEHPLGIEQGACEPVLVPVAQLELAAETNGMLDEPGAVLNGVCCPHSAGVFLECTLGSLERGAIHLGDGTDVPVV